jgi:hypothetical protein
MIIAKPITNTLNTMSPTGEKGRIAIGIELLEQKA